MEPINPEHTTMRQVPERAGQRVHDLLVHQARDAGGVEGPVCRDNAVKLPVAALLKECSSIGGFGLYELSELTKGVPSGMRTVSEGSVSF